jgi:hypothetical protein
MKRTIITRRQMLRGSGGVTLGLPFLPSLVPGRAHGADPVFTGPKRFVCIGSPHGAVLPENRDPAPAMAGTTMTLYPGHDIRYGRLTPAMNGGNTVLSPMLTAPSTRLTAALVAKMNVLRGFDIPWYIAHHTGGYLGNFARTDAQTGGVRATPTIDQVMAWSSKFYPDLAGVRQRSIVTGFDFRGMSWTWSNPQARSGSIDKVPVITSSSTLFDRLFAGARPAATAPTTSPQAAPARPPVVDALLASYRSLRQSSTRLSSEDRQRLDDHIAKLSEVERRVKAAPAAPGATGAPAAAPNCGAAKPKESATVLDQDLVSLAECKRRFGLLVDVVAMALACGASRIATIFQLYPFSDYAGDWHQSVAHQASSSTNQTLLTRSNQAQFESIVLNLAAQLDAIQEAPGRTVLDSTLIYWGQESGWQTHDAQDMNVVTFGGANGFFKTGYYVDYRNLSPTCKMGNRQLGLNHRQFLANCLLAMGLPPSDFESGGPGYGDPRADANYARVVHPNVVSRASDPLPVITG